MNAYLCHIVNTVLCMHQLPFSEEWDGILSRALSDGEVIGCRDRVLILKHQGDNLEIWCANRWYSFGNAWCVNGKMVSPHRQYRPRIRTMIRLWDVYKTERENRLDQEYKSLFKGR